MPVSFIDSKFATKKEYDEWLAGSGGAPTSSASAFAQPPTLGYWKIRGLAAACRMMLYFKKQPFVNKSYGEDAKTAWFTRDKPTLQTKNALMNLPYLVDGDTIVTQSNSCLVYLGKKLGIDSEALFVLNHQALDQTMDLRNDLMKIVYGGPAAGFKDAFQRHLQASAVGHFTKLERFMKGKYMCGDTIQSSDFHVFEMFDQHLAMIAEVPGISGVDLRKSFPKLSALHTAIKAEPSLQGYFAAPMYSKYAVNNPLYTHYKGAGFGAGPFGPTIEELVTP
jgi:glutathione S-transferase